MDDRSPCSTSEGEITKTISIPLRRNVCIMKTSFFSFCNFQHPFLLEHAVTASILVNEETKRDSWRVEPCLMANRLEPEGNRLGCSTKDRNGYGIRQADTCCANVCGK